MCSQCLAIHHNLFFQCKEVKEDDDIDWIPEGVDEDDDDDYYDEEGKAEEELLTLEDDEVDKQAEAKAINLVGGDILSLQQHIAEMDEAGDQAVANLQAPPLPLPEVSEAPADKVPQLPAEQVPTAPPEQPQAEVVNPDEGVADPVVVPRQELLGDDSEKDPDSTEIKLCLQ